MRRISLMSAIERAAADVPLSVGYDPDEDRARGFIVTENGITIVGKDQQVTG